MDYGYYFGDTAFEMSYTKKVPPRQRSDAALLDPDVQMELKAMGGAMGGSFRSTPSPIRAGIVLLIEFSKEMSNIRFLTEQPVYKKPDSKSSSIKRPVAKTNKPTLDITSASTKQVVDVVAKHELESILKKPAYTSEEK